jgi:hypothetical protein
MEWSRLRRHAWMNYALLNSLLNSLLDPILEEQAIDGRIRIYGESAVLKGPLANQKSKAKNPHETPLAIVGNRIIAVVGIRIVAIVSIWVVGFSLRAIIGERRVAIVSIWVIGFPLRAIIGKRIETPAP